VSIHASEQVVILLVVIVNSLGMNH
jgi:hypothetical protein